jgi:hypothetical protein
MKLSDLTTHQYYRGLNRRFDRRARQLARMRFKYAAGRARFERGGWHAAYVTTSAVMHADRRAWFDILRNPPIDRTAK